MESCPITRTHAFRPGLSVPPALGPFLFAAPRDGLPTRSDRALMGESPGRTNPAGTIWLLRILDVCLRQWETLSKQRKDSPMTGKNDPPKARTRSYQNFPIRA